MFKDLGILFNSKLLFIANVFSIKNKVLAVFGMIKRYCSDFLDPLAPKCLYTRTTLVRSSLEYALLNWDHNNVGHNNELEKVQNKVLRFIFHKNIIFKKLLTLVTITFKIVKLRNIKSTLTLIIQHLSH